MAESPPPTSHGNKEPSPNDVLIAVMGPTGAGKSTLINIATQSEQKLAESGDEDSCTDSVDAAPPFEHDGRRVILYDTPGFDDSRMSETQVLRIIIQTLEAQYRKGMTLHGIIYLHPIDQARIGGKARANFTLIQKICGETSLKNLVVLTNKWGRLSEAEREDKRKKFLAPGTFLDNAVKMEAQVAHNFDHTVDSVRSIISKIILNQPEPLLIQKELVEDNREFADTSAGQEADKRLLELEATLKKRMEEQVEEMKQAQIERDAIMEKESREQAEKHQQEMERIRSERLNLSRNYDSRIGRLEADLRAAQAAVVTVRPPAPAPLRPPAPVRSAPAPAPPRPRAATLESITSGKEHVIISVKHGLYVTCDQDQRTVSGRGYGSGRGRRWIFRKLDDGDWIIESASYDRYLATNSNLELRATRRREPWTIESESERSWGVFRLYNSDEIAGSQVLRLDDDTVGTPVSLASYRGRKDEKWEIQEM